MVYSSCPRQPSGHVHYPAPNRGRACRGCAGRRRGYPACEPRTSPAAPIGVVAGIPRHHFRRGRMSSLLYRRERERSRGDRYRRRRRGRAGRSFPHLPRRGPRRRQDVRDALRGSPTAGAGRRRGGRVRRGLRAAAHRGTARWPGGHPPPGGRVPGQPAGGDGPRGGPAPTARDRPDRRAGAHERAGIGPARETLARCPGHPGRRNRRRHHRQHPAPGKHRRRR